MSVKRVELDLEEYEELKKKAEAKNIYNVTIRHTHTRLYSDSANIFPFHERIFSNANILYDDEIGQLNKPLRAELESISSLCFKQERRLSRILTENTELNNKINKMKNANLFQRIFKIW
jgi:hypothetical protein